MTRPSRSEVERRPRTGISPFRPGSSQSLPRVPDCGGREVDPVLRRLSPASGAVLRPGECRDFPGRGLVGSEPPGAIPGIRHRVKGARILIMDLYDCSLFVIHDRIPAASGRSTPLDAEITS